MSRSADYTIKGFLYQFNKTILEILNSEDDSTVTVEGIVEDVEVATLSGTRAIQCKYHEASDAFTPSGIFKPLLQMVCHFHANPDAGIRYTLYAHYPCVNGPRGPTVGRVELQAALASKNKDLRRYVLMLKGDVDLDEFLSVFDMQFGPSYDDLVEQVVEALAANGIPPGEIDTLAYPNAINYIAGLSVRHHPAERITTKRRLLDELSRIRTTAISRWTMALRTRKQLLTARRTQLKTHLDKNARLRYFVLNAESLVDFDAEIVAFVVDYLDRYHFKPAHLNTPVLCLRTSEESFKRIQKGLHDKRIVTTDGYVGGQFNREWFLRDPICNSGPRGVTRREFSLRVLRWDDRAGVLDCPKCDDLFIIGEANYDPLDIRDVCVERLAATSLKEVKYLMGVSNVYE